jgi:hydroxyquinol 1,2-dioxygenase
VNSDELTRAVIGRAEKAADPRVGELLSALIRHLHEFIVVTGCTPEEWRHGLDFLARAGEFCTPDRHELILLSDLLGCSALVDAQANAGPPEMTPSTVEGPFHTPAPPRELGAIIATGAEWQRGDWAVLRGTVRGTGGQPVAGASIDLWQSDDLGLYDVQDAGQERGNLRALLTAGPAGEYWARTVRPSSYPVPTDGPGGELLRAIGHHPMRPAHIHAQVSAPGYRTLTTHLFVAGDEYLGSDAAWGVRDGLIVVFARNADADAIARYEMPGPFYDVAFDFVLVRA